jgi:hypothetical protein
MLYHFYLSVIVRTAFLSGKRKNTPFSFVLSSPLVPSSLLNFVLQKVGFEALNKKVVLGFVGPKTSALKSLPWLSFVSIGN